ncbi:hypothetical protein [Haloarchaeobius sp. TZWWS8]|uniref:hypothetical protein n=1 Tax=Haloarchaeobius sp. TZWWS8 TaxID=3446121 RepID=UPI003EC07A42
MKRREVLGALGTVGAGGCLRLEGDSSETADEPDDASPSNTTGTAQAAADERTTQESAQDTEELPLGMDQDGVSPLLADAHRSAAATTTYHLETTLEKVGEGTAHWITVDKADGTALLGREGIIEKYLTESRSTWRGDHRGDWTYGDVEPPWRDGLPMEWLAQRYQLKQLIAGAAFDAPSRTETAGETLFTASASEVADEAPLLELYDWTMPEEVAAVSVEITADADGLVRECRAETKLVSGDDLRVMDHRFAFTDVGSTEVVEPSWLGTAREKAARIDSRVEDDFFVLEHAGGNDVVADSVLKLGSSQYYGDVPLSAPLRAGQSLWAWREGNEISATVGRPDQASPDYLLPETNVHLTYVSADYAATSIEHLD